MKLTKGSEFAMLVLLYLAEKKRKAKTHEIAKDLDISLNHLHKIVKTLANGGYLINTPGRSGGIQLVANPEKITLFKIITLIDGPIFFANCLLNQSTCSLSSMCKLKDTVEDAQNRMLDVFKNTTIKKLVEH